ncbi:SOS response-associated peptidase [Flavobacteriales bacterium]|jgi:putative SOS response-associated peptidase YedK|nr:SOS response-associated peptidase [Flavobacteriales bacterium]
MCGRYVTVTSVKAIEKRFQVTAGPGYTDAPPPPNTNVSHGDAAPVITGDQPKALQAMQFGFTPSWAKKQFYMINARSEGDHNAENDPGYRGAMGILQKPMFRQSIRTRRCLVVADAFIEGPQREKLAKPYVVYARDGQRPFALAGIWDEWTDTGSGEIIRSFAIITTTACDAMNAIGHHRSPVMLDPEDERKWIDPVTPLAEATALLRPIPDGKLNAYPIDTAIKNPRLNGTTLLQPTGERIFPEYDFELHQSLQVFGMGESPGRQRRSGDSPKAQGSLF